MAWRVRPGRDVTGSVMSRTGRETRDTDPPRAHRLLEQANDRIRSVRPGWTGELYTGVDLGTSSCVLTVVDSVGEPVWVDTHATAALRDGVVVDFAEAASAVRLLKHTAERALGVELQTAATAYPPLIGREDSRACRFVVEAAGFVEVTLVDEVSAANRTLDVTDGVVVDVGGGSTGVGVFRDGELSTVDDRPGGGHQLDLILAGSLHVGLTEAERLKREDGASHLALLRPGLERIAESVRALTVGADDLDLHLAGGALMLPGAAEVIGRRLGRTVRSYPHALLITPLGIARYAL